MTDFTPVMVDYYSGREAQSLKMGSVFLFVRFLSVFWCCRFCTLDAERFTAWWHVLCCLTNCRPSLFSLELFTRHVWINSSNLLPCVNRSTATNRMTHTVTRCDICQVFSQPLSNSVAAAHKYGFIVISVFSASVRFSDWLQTSNMKLFAISESHLTLSEVSMREQG